MHEVLVTRERRAATKRLIVCEAARSSLSLVLKHFIIFICVEKRLM